LTPTTSHDSPGANSPWYRLIAAIENSADDEDVTPKLDSEARLLYDELQDIQRQVKSLDSLAPVEEDYDVAAFLRRAGVVASADTSQSTGNEKHKRGPTAVEEFRSEGSTIDSPLFDSPKLPQTLGDYEIVREIGRGGSATVYQARHKLLRRDVVIKRMKHTCDADRLRRFRREMRAVGMLNHPNIVVATDAREINHELYLITEFIDGPTLSQVIRRVGPLRCADAFAIGFQIASGLVCLHEKSMVHRDVKPANVMMTKEGVVKLLDLGLVRFHESSSSGSAITASGVAIGSLQYMAPEQYDDTHQVDIRADLYATGATLYALLTGRSPLNLPPGSDVAQQIAAITLGKVTPLAQLRNDLPTQAIELLERLMAHDPQARFATPNEAISAMQPLLHGSDLIALYDKAMSLSESNQTGVPKSSSQTAANTAQPSVNQDYLSDNNSSKSIGIDGAYRGWVSRLGRWWKRKADE
jgi:serine/threonine protein kinase